MQLDAIPAIFAIPAAVLVVIGSTLALLGTLGLVRLKSFYDRLHAPTLGTSWGAAGILLASMILFSWQQERVVLHELVIGAFVMATTPVTLMLLGRAALHRDRAEQSPDLPPIARLPGEAPEPVAKDPETT